jgi:hypothetical protein
VRRRSILALIAFGASAGACRPAPPAHVVIENRLAPPEAPTGPGFHGPITEESLAAMMRERFADQLAAGTFTADFSGTTADLLAELDARGIRDLGALARLIPRDYVQRAEHAFSADNPANIPGVLRDVMIIHDARRYFHDAWKNHWQSLSTNDAQMYRTYRVDLDVLVDAGVISREAAASRGPRP